MRTLALLFLAGCSAAGSTNAVNLTIVSDSSVTADLRAKVSELDIDVTGVQTKSAKYPLSGLPAEERVQLLPKVTSGTITIAVSVKDAKTNVLGKGSVDVELNGKIVAKTVTLVYTPPAKINVTPATATLTRGKTLQLMADQTVTWSASAGTIDMNGLFTAPDAAGAVTVTATSPTDDTNQATAMITVADYGVELLAGKPGGWGEADGVGGAARFFGPTAVSSDGNGTLYIGELLGCSLRKYVAATQSVRTLTSGNPGCGFTDGKLDTDARFANINALALDSTTQTLYVAQNNSIRKVDLAAGSVSTLDTGGWTFSLIKGLALDVNSNTLYVSDAGDQAIIQFPLGPSPSPSPIAGTRGAPGSADAPSGPATAASFNNPSGLVFDNGKLYVADTVNHTIRQITLVSGVVTTLAGMAGMSGTTDGVGSAARLTSPRALALNGGTLFIGEGTINTIRTLSIANGSVTRVAGQIQTPPMAGGPPFGLQVDGAPGTTASFNRVVSLVFDASLNRLYAVDKSTLRSISGGNFGVTTEAGAPENIGSQDGPGSIARFWQPASISGDGQNVYIVENNNAVVRKYDLEAGSVTTIAGTAMSYGGDDGVGSAARFSRPEGIFVDGTVAYVADGGGSTIRKLDLTTNLVTTIAGEYLVAGTTNGMGTDARFSNPLYITGDHQGTLYVSDGTIIRQIALSSGAVTTLAGNPAVSETSDGVGTSAHFSTPWGLAIENNSLYVCDASTIRSINLADSTVTTVAGSATNASIVDATGLAARLFSLVACSGDGNGHIYLADGGVFRRFDVASQAVTTIFGSSSFREVVAGPLTSANLNFAQGISILPGGDAVVSDVVDNVLLRVRMP